MKAPVSSIRNLGPVSERQYGQAGIHSADEIRSLGPINAYSRLLASGAKAHFTAYSALVLGLEDRHWTDASTDEKRRIRREFDAIVAQHLIAECLDSRTRNPDSHLDMALDTVGLIK
ncbi:MAG: TfoX/Sxy family DNA transformation protein [Paracoccaceae bacterium]|nr:TfoX/Sxy family DNA transformation protein [Paracoccaceae bacterium]